MRRALEMVKRVVALFVVSFIVTVALVGCDKGGSEGSVVTNLTGNPDTLFNMGKYSEAYTAYVIRAGSNDVALKADTSDTKGRQKCGNQAIHDYYYAAECQTKLGNTEGADAFYQKVVELSKYQIVT